MIDAPTRIGITVSEHDHDQNPHTHADATTHGLAHEDDVRPPGGS
jgi:hypothetical protein